MDSFSMKLPNMEVYDDDESRPADCKVDTAKSHARAEMFHLVGRLEKSKSVPPMKLLGPEFKPRAVLQAVKDRAVNGARAALACIDREKEHLILIYSETADESFSRLATLKATGFVLGTMLFNLDGQITCYPEPDEDNELTVALLNFLARIIERGQSPEASFDALLALVRDKDFLAQTQARRALDEFVQSNENAPIDENVLARFDALKDKFPEIAKILDGDPSDFNFQHN
jgi:hypothetical protein